VKKLLFTTFLFLNFYKVNSQTTDSCGLRISLLTCSPGQEIYSVFGHSALRLTDTKQGFDIIFNYGTFDFEDPNFLAKFGRGNLLYFVSVEEFNGFVEQYRREKRNITEQELNLTCVEKEKLNAFLKNNAKEENKYYLYNFLFDNCSSRLKDIVAKNSSSSLVFQNILPSPHTTFRDLIHEYMDKGKQPWTKMGLDMLLGNQLDIVAKNEQAMFLPEYLMKAFDNGKIGDKNLITDKKTVLSVESPITESGLPGPLVFFSVLFMLIAAISFLKKKWVSILLNGIDFLLFFTAGLTGLLLLALWLVRTDTVCRNNFNLVWALPTHLIMTFLLFSKKSWTKKYWLITAILQALLLLTWFFLPQQLNSALLSIVALLLLRSFMRYRKT
jgi:Domain of unknown function (DUF4105)